MPSDTQDIELNRELHRIQTGINTMAGQMKDSIRELEVEQRRAFSRLSELERRAAKEDGSPYLSTEVGGGAAFLQVQEHDGFKRLLAGATDSGRIAINMPTPALQRAALLGGAAPGGLPIESARQGLVGPQPARLTLFDVLRRQPVVNGQIEYVQIGFGANNAAPQVEGATKAEATAATAVRTAAISTIANWITASRQSLSDSPQLFNVLSDAFRNRVLSKAHNLLIAGNGTTDQISGLATEATAFVSTATTDVDAVSEAQATLDAAGYSAGVVLLNPLRWHAIRTTRADTGDGQYLAGSWNQPAAPNIWSVPVVTASAVGINEAIVLDPAVAVLLDREQATVLISTEDRDNFIKNLVTILAEVRLGLAVTDKGGVLKFALPE